MALCFERMLGVYPRFVVIFNIRETSSSHTTLLFTLLCIRSGGLDASQSGTMGRRGKVQA